MDNLLCASINFSRSSRKYIAHIVVGNDALYCLVINYVDIDKVQQRDRDECCHACRPQEPIGGIRIVEQVQRRLKVSG